MRQIIHIDRIEKAKPEKGVWFDYYGDIFVSVIPIEKRSHIRRKTNFPDRKKDNKMSAWHLKWQYEIIENTFGMGSSGKKTYEIPINVDGERHIIDSLISDRIAIEFQHTLSVALEEMDHRIRAHKKAGFIPYLVLDFSSYTYSQFNGNDEKLAKQLKKWLNSDYYKKDNLFLDLEDKIIRLSENVIGGHIRYNQDEFVQQLLNLETFLKGSINACSARKEKEREERRIKKIRAEERKKEREEYYLQIKKEENREEKFKSEDYKYFRKCYRDKVILPFIIEYAKDLFRYQNGGENVGENIYEKCHSFFSEERNFVIHYVNVSHFEDIEYQTRWGNNTKRKFNFLYSYVDIYIGEGYNRTEHRFDFENGKTIKKK